MVIPIGHDRAGRGKIALFPSDMLILIHSPQPVHFIS